VEVGDGIATMSIEALFMDSSACAATVGVSVEIG